MTVEFLVEAKEAPHINGIMFIDGNNNPVKCMFPKTEVKEARWNWLSITARDLYDEIAQEELGDTHIAPVRNLEIISDDHDFVIRQVSFENDRMRHVLYTQLMRG